MSNAEGNNVLGADATGSSGTVFKPNNDVALLRSRLPVPQPDKSGVNLWSYLKHCVGKELHKITMPVQWNEPISLLQRVSEYMNYAHLLRAASESTDAEVRMQWVAAFAVSALASNFKRLAKPFNPLLGETYELERKDFRILCEQVGHHPPVTAFRAEGANFVFRGSMYPKMKFWGKSVEFQPKGTLTVELPEWNDVYTWTNVNCVVHNVIVGALWMEQIGTMEIVNQTTNHRCFLEFSSSASRGGWFSSSASNENDLYAVEGFVVSQAGKKVKFLYGKWTEFLCAAEVSSLQSLLDIADMEKVKPDASNLPKHPALEVGAIPSSQVLWNVDPRPECSPSYYNFSAFSMGLNQLLPIEQQAVLCETDCRKRPDIRSLEEGELDAAAREKERLEHKQREYRKPFKGQKSESDWWTPRWFTPVKNKYTGEDDWKYKGDYWESKARGRYDNVPDIF